MQLPGRHSALPALLVPLLFTCAALSAGDQASGPVPAAFSICDWRVQIKETTAGGSNQAFVTFTLKNQTGAAVKAGMVTLEYNHPTAGGLVTSEKKSLTALKVGESVAVQTSVRDIRSGGEYRLVIAYPSGDRTCLLRMGGGTPDLAPAVGAAAPVPMPAEGSTSKPGTAATELTAGSWKVERIKDSKDVQLTGKITNHTAHEANNVKVTIHLTKKATTGTPTTVLSVTVPCDRPLAPGASADLGARATDCPEFDGMIAEVAYDALEAPRSKALGEAVPDTKGEWVEGMVGGPRVEIGFTDVTCDTKGTIAMIGKLRNGLKQDVQMESMDLEFTTASGQVKKTNADLRGKIKAGTLCSVKLLVPAMGDFEQYSYKLVFRQ